MSDLKSTIFLDRDGCLIVEVDYLSQISQIKLISGVAEALKSAKEAGFLLVMVTNQSGVARGYFDEAFVAEANDHVNGLLGGMLDGIFYCPHHLKGNAPYNVDCNCRKPKTGMIEQAQKALPIQRQGSWMIGDKIADVKLGQDAGFDSILVETGHGMEEKSKVAATFPKVQIAADLPRAIDFILKDRKTT